MSKAKFADTMIGSPDMKKTAAFYQSFLGMKLADKGDGSFLILKDPRTAQRLCIVKTPKASTNAGIGIETSNLEVALTNLKKRGGKVLGTWEYPKMIGANATDGDGHELLLWQTLKPKAAAKAPQAKKSAPVKKAAAKPRRK